MSLKSDSDATHCSEAENMMTCGDQAVRRSQRLSQKSTNYNYWWYTGRLYGTSKSINPISKSEINTNKISPTHNANRLTKKIFSSTNIREEKTENTLTQQQETVTEFQKYISTPSTKSRFEPCPKIPTARPQQSDLLTQVILPPMDIKEDKESHDILTLKQNRSILRYNPYSKIASPSISTSKEKTLTTASSNEFSESHDVQQQKYVNVRQVCSQALSRTLKSLSNSKIKSPPHNANTIIEDISSHMDIQYMTNNSLILHQNPIITRFEPNPKITSPRPLESALLTQVIFSPTDIIEDQESHDILTLKQIKSSLTYNPYSKLASPSNRTSKEKTLTTTCINECCESLDALTQQQKCVNVPQICSQALSRTLKSQSNSKNKSPDNAFTTLKDISSHTDIQYMTNNNIMLYQKPIKTKSASKYRKRKKINDVPLDLTTKKSKVSSCKTSGDASCPIGPLHDNIHTPIVPRSNALNKIDQDSKSENIFQTNSKKVRRPRTTSTRTIKRSTKNRGAGTASRKRNPKSDFFQNIGNSTNLQMITGNLKAKQLFKTSLLPDIYPPHFKYQLPPEALLTQPLIPTQPDIMTPDDTQSFELKDSTSTSPSLPESLRDVFGTHDLKHLLDIEMVKYNLYDYHVQALAVVLNVREQFLHDILQKILKINPSSLRKMSKALKSPFMEDRDLFTRPASTEYRSPSSDAVPNSHSPAKSCRKFKLC